MFSPFSPIPQPQSPMEAFRQGMSTSQEMFNSIMNNRLVNANTQAQLARNPYIAPMSQAQLTNQNNINQMYIPKTQSEIDLAMAQAGDQNAAARLKNQLYNNPMLGRSGTIGDIAASAYGNPTSSQPAPIVGQGVSSAPQSVSPILQKFPQLMNNSTPVGQQPNLMQMVQSSMSPNYPNNMTPIPGSTQPQAQDQNIAQPQGNQNPLLQRDLNAQVAEQEAKANFYNMGGSRGGVDQKSLIGLQQQIATENPNFSPEQVNQAASAYLAGDRTLPDGTKLSDPSGDVRYYLNSMDKHVNTATGLKQQNADAILDGLLGKGDLLMPNVSQFAGLAGKSLKTASQIGSSLGNDDQRFSDYLKFTRQIVPQVANQMLLTEGARVNNTQKAMMLKVADPTYWDSNPKQALDQWNYLTDTMKNLIKPIVSQGPSGIRETLTNKNNSNPAATNSASSQTINWIMKNGKLERAS